MKVVILTTDNREQFKHYERPEPYFGTAPAGLLVGFEEMDDVEVHVISCSKHPAKAPEKLGRNIWFHQPLVQHWGWGRTLFSGCVRAVRQLVRKIDPDIVHGQGTERDCAISAVLSGRPNVLTLHGNMRIHAARPENKNAHYYKMAAVLERLCLMKTDGVIAISSYTQTLTQPFTKTWLLPNAVDSTLFSVTPSPPPIPRLIAVGAICERKNPITLIHAAEPLLRSRACTLAFAGQGDPASPYTKEFYHLAGSIPGIELLGFLNRESLKAQLACSTALILPTFEDNCPMVVLEGMAAGLPVAASHVGGVPDLITHDVDGIMFDPDKPETIRSAVESLLTDTSLRRRLAEQGRKTARERFHPEVIARKHIEIYREVLGG